VNPPSELGQALMMKKEASIGHASQEIVHAPHMVCVHTYAHIFTHIHTYITTAHTHAHAHIKHAYTKLLTSNNPAARNASGPSQVPVKGCPKLNGAPMMAASIGSERKVGRTT